jgi:hypothetical protein
MATIKAPKGRMTKPLATPYEVGDVVRLTRPFDGDTTASADPVARDENEEICEGGTRQDPERSQND